ncbi:MAG: hypothetical protein GY708_19910, partial [Actinomycetia bacterium]|nr:hypothetical protein [Actinomycetes bacterium]
AGGTIGTGSGTGTILDDDAVVFDISTATPSLLESNDVRFTIDMSGASLDNGHTASVDVAHTLSDTAPADYAVALGAAITAAIGALPLGHGVIWDGTTLTFSDNGPTSVSSLTFELTTFDDTLLEGDESFSIDLANASTSVGAGTATIATGSAANTILDDDPVQFDVSTGVLPVLEGGGAVFTIRMSGATLANGNEASVDVGHTLIDTNAADYSNTLTAAINAAIGALPLGHGVTWNGTTLTFSDNGPTSVTSLDFTLQTFDDAIFEGNEDFSINLSTPLVNGSPGDATIGFGVANKTIQDNDQEATVSVVGDESANEGNALIFTVDRTGTTGGDVTVQYDANDVTATAGSDYTDVTGTLTFTEGGATRLFVTVDTIEDTALEGDETLTLTLTGAAGGTIGTGSGTGTILDDDAVVFDISTATPSLLESNDVRFTIDMSGA